MDSKTRHFDIFIIGGGINGVGIARDAAGRGLKVGLAEMKDLGEGTSSASTKLFHGGLRYLEYFQFRLVKESLKEREILLSSMPHISWPLRFILPHNKEISLNKSSPAARLISVLFPWSKTKRPFWLIWLGLVLYDNLGGRKILQASKYVNFKPDGIENPLKSQFKSGFEYSDCWVDDSRLVILNARDAHYRGAKIMPRHKVTSAKRSSDGWIIEVRNQSSGEIFYFNCKLLVNASGPWIRDVNINIVKSNFSKPLRLIKGSHIITKKLYNHKKCYFLQGIDGRVVFTIPYENEYTLIGTTEKLHENISDEPICSASEQQYLLDSVNEYFKNPLKKNDIVWSYAGIRPLFDDGSESSSSVTREYHLDLEKNKSMAPILNIYGGKITTYRKLAEDALRKVNYLFPEMGEKWTENSSLPGGNFELKNRKALEDDILSKYKFLEKSFVLRLVRSYGTEVYTMLENKTNKDDLGLNFGEVTYGFEIDWGTDNEWVQNAEDFVWRRTKLGLLLSKNQIDHIDRYIQDRRETQVK